MSEHEALREQLAATERRLAAARARRDAAEAKVARVEALADEQADECYSPGVHTKCKGHALRRALSAPQPADAPEGHGDADEAGGGDVNRGVRLYIETLRRMNPSPRVQAALDEIEAEMREGDR